MLEIDHLFTSTGSSGGLTPVHLGFGVGQSVLYFDNDTLATTQTISFQTAPDSTGPWVTEASTSISTVGSTRGIFRLSGPMLWARVYLHTASTGTYRARLIGVS